jgi:ribosomal protein S18 acetylase RimI-like enzyme
MSDTYQLQRLSLESDLVPRLVALHLQCLPHTLTSNRGARTVEGLYRHLLSLNHEIYAAVRGGDVIGGVVVTKAGMSAGTSFLLLHRPISWILAFGRLGPKRFFQQLTDLIFLRIRMSDWPPHDYIIALYVAERSRRLGVATTLLRQCTSTAALSHVALGVDTAIDNVNALDLYRSSGFIEQSQTRISVLLKRNAE